MGKKFAKLHVLHATGYGRGNSDDGQEDDPGVIKDGTRIAEYKVRYDDGTSETIPVVYGQDVRDWWFTEASKGVSRGKVAWKGDNELAKGFDIRIRLYLTTWENPDPNKTVTAIDYVKTGDSVAAPFCVALTLEAK